MSFCASVSVCVHQNKMGDDGKSLFADLFICRLALFLLVSILNTVGSYLVHPLYFSSFSVGKNAK